MTFAKVFIWFYLILASFTSIFSVDKCHLAWNEYQLNKDVSITELCTGVAEYGEARFWIGCCTHYLGLKCVERVIPECKESINDTLRSLQNDAICQNVDFNNCLTVSGRNGDSSGAPDNQTVESSSEMSGIGGPNMTSDAGLTENSTVHSLSSINSQTNTSTEETGNVTLGTKEANLTTGTSSASSTNDLEPNITQTTKLIITDIDGPNSTEPLLSTASSTLVSSNASFSQNESLKYGFYAAGGAPIEATSSESTPKEDEDGKDDDDGKGKDKDGKEKDKDNDDGKHEGNATTGKTEGKQKLSTVANKEYGGSPPPPDPLEMNSNLNSGLIKSTSLVLVGLLSLIWFFTL